MGISGLVDEVWSIEDATSDGVGGNVVDMVLAVIKQQSRDYLNRKRER